MKWLGGPGEVLYWTSTVIAGLIVLLVVANYMSNTGMGEPIIGIIPLLLAGAIWLAGGGWPPCVRWTLIFVRHNQTETPPTKRRPGTANAQAIRMCWNICILVPPSADRRLRSLWHAICCPWP